jgi:hypothetical protein
MNSFFFVGIRNLLACDAVEVATGVDINKSHPDIDNIRCYSRSNQQDHEVSKPHSQHPSAEQPLWVVSISWRRTEDKR